MKRFAFLFVGALLLAACDREKRELNPSPPSPSKVSVTTLSELQPGPRTPQYVIKNDKEANAFQLAEGQRLFSWYNCSGCHAHGGGGMGPPLMDDKWIYGSDPENVHASIVQGRPNGMPAFGGRIPDDQVWQLVAYVRSMSGLAEKIASPGRLDEMQAKVSEMSKKEEDPKPQSGGPDPVQ